MLLSAAIFIAAGVLLWPHIALFTDPEQARRIIADAGPWGPLVFIGLQIAQVFFAPIPGQITGLAGGYLFGMWAGTLYALIGAAIGFTLIFILARKLGRPFVERFVDKKYLDKFDYITKTNGTFIFFIIFLLPAFPDDIICYLAGLTTIKIRTLVIISVIGRIPGYLVLSLTGAGVADANLGLVGIVLTLMLVLCAVAFWQRARLERFVKRLAQKQ